jgi:hypothetical protein
MNPADRPQVIDLLTRLDDARTALSAAWDERRAHLREAKAVNHAPDRQLLGDLNDRIRMQQERITALGDALALLGVPPSPHTRPMSIAEYAALPDEYKQAIARWESAKKNAQPKKVAE